MGTPSYSNKYIKKKLGTPNLAQKNLAKEHSRGNNFILD